MPGEMQHSPAYVIWQALVDEGFGVDPETDENGRWPIFDNHHPDDPDDLIKISDTTGRDFGHTQVDGEVQELDGIQVMVRSADKDEGWRKARQIARYLDQLNQKRVTLEQIGTAGNADYVIHAVSRIGGIPFLGTEEPTSKRFLFSFNCLCSIRMCC